MKKLGILLLLLALLLSGCDITHDTIPKPLCDAHTDGDDNGICDSCAGSVIVVLDFYSINDLHGKLADGDSHPGVDELTTFLKTMQATENTILLSTGDMWQGSSESNLTKGLIMTDWMNELDFAAMTLGNHEYDWGEEWIETNAAAAEFPFLAINIYDRETDKPVDYCDASVVVEIQGLQIGIIGAIGDCYSSISADKVEDVYFKTGDALTALVKAEAERLRAEEGVDFVVYSLHDGWNTTGNSYFSASELAPYYNIELSDGYVDLVFEGHTHQKYMAPDEHGVYHLQHKGDNNGGISHTEISINSVTGTYTATEASLISTGSYGNMADDPIVKDLLEKYEKEISPANRILGTNGTFRNSNALRQLVADLYYDLGQATWGTEYDITLGGGFISVRNPYELPKGEVKYSQLQSLFPFDNDIVLCAVKGQDLLNKFIHSNNSNYYISGNYADIDPNGIYYIVVDTYTATYAPNRLTIVESYTPGIYARDLLADYIEDGGME